MAVVAIVAIFFIVTRVTLATHKSDPANNSAANSTASAGDATSGLAPATLAHAKTALPSVAPSTESPAAAASAPPPPAAPVDPRYRITGIMKDPDGKYCAVINGKIVSETQFVDGATIKKIERDRVTLEIAGRESILRLF